MNTVLSLLIGMAGAQVVSLVKLAMRMRWQVVRDRLRYETLTELATQLPSAGAVEFDEVADGGRVRVYVTAGQQGERESDVRT